MDDNTKEFILAYTALCKKHQLCVANRAAAPLYVIEYTTVWVEDVVLCEGREVYEAYQQQVKDGH